MFKNYLTYQFALTFHRACAALDHVPATVKDRLMTSAELLIHKFACSIHSKDEKDQLRFACVALICLRDCREILDENHISHPDVDSRYSVLHGRLEQICAKAADAEGGQLRMLG